MQAHVSCPRDEVRREGMDAVCACRAALATGSVLIILSSRTPLGVLRLYLLPCSLRQASSGPPSELGAGSAET